MSMSEEEEEVAEAVVMPPENNLITTTTTTTTTRRMPCIFYKLIVPSIIQEQQLGIPKKFIKKFGDELHGIANLTTSNPGIWPVCLKRDNERIWFHEGWQDFVEDQSICAGCFLLFRYEGSSNFYVDIFNLGAPGNKYSHNASAILEEIAGGKQVQPPYKKEDAKETSDVMDHNSSCKNPSIHEGKDYHDGHMMSCRIYCWNDSTKSTVVTGFHADVPVMSHRMIVITRDIGIQVDEKEPKETNNKVEPYQSLLASTHCGKRKVKAEPDEHELPTQRLRATEPQNVFPSNIFSTKLAASIEGTISAASSFKSDHPFVCITLKPSYVYTPQGLYIPSWFARKHLKGVSRIIRLQLLDGILWPVELVFGKRDTAFLRSGWHKVVKHYKLEEGDFCVFELVEKVDTVMKISIFRVADYTSQLANSQKGGKAT